MPSGFVFLSVYLFSPIFEMFVTLELFAKPSRCLKTTNNNQHKNKRLHTAVGYFNVSKHNYEILLDFTTIQCTTKTLQMNIPLVIINWNITYCPVRIDFYYFAQQMAGLMVMLACAETLMTS